MGYYRGDYYRGDYYRAGRRGDFLGSLGALVGSVAKNLPGIGPVIRGVDAVRGIIAKSPKAVTTIKNVATALPIPGLAPMVPYIADRMYPQSSIPAAERAMVVGPTGAVYMRGRRRRMNFANGKALRRAIRREKGFVKMARSVLKGTGLTISRKGVASKARGKR